MPDVSVIVATRNRAAALARTLEALARQNLADLSCEFVIVDNGSSDRTPEIIAEASRRLPIVALTEPEAGKNRALNTGIDVARAKLLVFTDDDVVPQANWLASLFAATHRWPEENVFGGEVIPQFPPSAPSWMTDESFPYGRWAFSRYRPRPDEGPTWETPLGPNMALRARVLSGTRFSEEIGPEGTDYPMGSEVELLLRLYRRGEQFIFVPDAVVQHVIPERHVTKAALSLRAFRCGRGNARLFPEVGNFPLFGIPAHVMRRAAAAVARRSVSPFRHERERWLAAMTFHQVRGNIHERRLMLREAANGPSPGSVPPRRFPTRRAIVDGFRRRGILGTIAMPFAWIGRPLARGGYWQLFECDLRRHLPRCGIVDGVSVEVFSGSVHSRAVRVALCPLEILTPEEIDARLRRGDSVAIAYEDSRAIGYAWCAFSDHPMSEIESTLRVGATEVAGYDGMVIARRRGSRILPLLDQAQLDYARRRGRERQIVYTRVRNRACVHSLLRMGKRRTAKVVYVRFRGVNLVVRHVLGGPAEERFSASGSLRRATASASAEMERSFGDRRAL